MAKHQYTCDGCGVTAHSDAAWKLRNPPVLCLACIRVKNGWTCTTCGSSDSHHALPCQIETSGAGMSQGVNRHAGRVEHPAFQLSGEATPARPKLT